MERRLSKSLSDQLGIALQWLVDLQALQVKAERGTATDEERRRIAEDSPVAWQSAGEALKAARRCGEIHDYRLKERKP